MGISLTGRNVCEGGQGVVIRGVRNTAFLLVIGTVRTIWSALTGAANVGAKRKEAPRG